ncbi:MATE family efflux transporter [Derxia gummosa]|uniref:Multidrug-efflux transporter n=1 Tax=Derxia gummosa DSM 723 TaxID=1121388 RepID=A0A8B6X808_9BURK|nr:MATE family efflux transporter [Derxia gummosa]
MSCPDSAVGTPSRRRLPGLSPALRRSFGLAWPVAFQDFALILTQFVVLLMAARLGSVSIAAVGLVDTISFAVTITLTSLAVGTAVMTAHAVGAGRTDLVEGAARAGLLLGLGAGAACALALEIGRHALFLRLFPGTSAEVVDEAMRYQRWIVLGFLPAAVELVGSGALRGRGQTRFAMLVNLLMSALNLLLAWLWIEGAAGFAPLGVTGAGLAQFIARCAGAVAVLVVLRGSLRWPAWRRGWGSLRWQAWRSGRAGAGGLPRSAAGAAGSGAADGNLFRALVAISLPTALESLLFAVGKLLGQTFVAGMGTAAVAANAIAAAIVSLLFIPGNALGTAASTLVGQALGRGDRAAARATLAAVLRAAGAVLLPLAVTVALGAGFIADVYRAEPAVRAMALPAVWGSCASLVIWPLSFVLPAGLRGAGDARHTMLVAVGTMWAGRVVIGWTLGVWLGFGMVGVWAGMYADWFLRAGLYWWRFRGEGWMRRRVLGAAATPNET